MYQSIYGRNRVERAIMMYKNQEPRGYIKPPPGSRTFRALGITANFTVNSVYVEDFENPQMPSRGIVVGLRNSQYSDLNIILSKF